ncbi:geranylgeranyl diphosphate synthase, type II [Noviherbaspirillum humi]|uniref:Geranylgeranyl diphosphate synthase, type II n=1 Tax=Noviherbaspirillum humi TaxID=1688639 RepID=A0A239L3X2_9BURK|nr:polyprenyl synthetase family protein [Noviherbaspirillum humi]SNT25010.1 geranylgeranyl diphosphate synthase, type II [Noviherbaspirillum humi]
MLATDAADYAASDWIARSRVRIDRHLDQLLASAHPSPVMEAMRYSVLAPGKRVRPLLTLAVADCLAGNEDAALQVGCAIEMIHCASLILDDLPCMDNDRERRSRLCTHVAYGESLTILAAVSLLTQSQCIIASDDGLNGELRLKLIQLLCHTVGPSGLSLGQYHDLNARGDKQSAAAITDIHHLKTGVLFLAAARAGCLVSHASPEQEESVMRFATHVGLAFQLRDDMKDKGEAAPNLVARIGVSSAERRLADYMQAAEDALAGEANTLALRQFAAAFFQ